MSSGIIVVLLAVLGAVFASFLEVVADRLPREERPFGRSSCFSCGRRLAWFELVPLLSWLLLRGRCRSCGARIPVRHAVGEFGLGLAFVIAFVTLQPFDPWVLVFRLLVLCAAFVIVFADFRYYIIPDIASVGLSVLFLMVLASRAFLVVPWDSVLPPTKLALLGGVFGALFLGAFSLISRGQWMGWGDVKLAAALGLGLGFPAILYLLTLSFILGSAAGIFLIVSRRKGMRDLLPFGPFIIFAALPFLFGFGSFFEHLFGLRDFLSSFQ